MIARLILAFQRIGALFGLRPDKLRKKKISSRSLPPRKPGRKKAGRKGK
jgi:hypothetical protein